MTARILIVEDEMLVAMEMEAVLEDLGFQPVGIAADSQTALELAATKPDVALVDLNLRDGLTGPTVGELLSKQHGITVLFVTANPRLVSAGVGGALGVIEKPCDDAAIASAIGYALDYRKGLPAMPPPGLIAFANSAGLGSR